MAPDPLARMRELQAEREPYYTRSDQEVTVDKQPAQAVAEHVVRLARQGAGW
jgi:hypothetical protein